MSNLRTHLAAVWHETRRLFPMVVGVIIVALGYTLFQVPYGIAAGGVSGVAIILNNFTGWPIGVMVLVMNIPLIVLGFFYLGRWPFVVRTLLAVVVFSTAIDLFLAYLPVYLEQYPITDDILLSAVYGGLVGGVGGGIVYRSGSTTGGTSILGRVIQIKTGIPLSQVYIYTDGGIIFVAGIVFGWEIALYALLTLFLNGLATDYTMEGPSSVRTATIVTNDPERVSQALINDLQRGVSHWEITGAYTGKKRFMLLCTISRSQVKELKDVVARIDEEAFVIVGVAHEALGFGFRPLKKKVRGMKSIRE
jgi:uncharacterized membrane-anchored protein YitT (DUF2179 family)